MNITRETLRLALAQAYSAGALDGGNHEDITVSGILNTIVTDTCGYCNHEFALEDWNTNGGNCPWCGCN